MSKNEIDLGTVFKNLRKRMGFTQQEVALLANVSYSSYRKYETVGVIPNIFDGVKILGALQVKSLHQIYEILNIEIYKLKI